MVASGFLESGGESSHNFGFVAPPADLWQFVVFSQKILSNGNLSRNSFPMNHFEKKLLLPLPLAAVLAQLLVVSALALFGVSMVLTWRFGPNWLASS